MKRNLKGTTKIRIHENYVALQLCFGIMDKNYLEEITRQDCRNLCEKIYCVPKRWSKKIQSTPILNLLVKNSSCDTIGRKTIKEYLTTFKEFMRYAVKEEIIQNSMNDFIDMPIKNDSLVREPFTAEELHKIFGPKLYSDPHSRKNSAKFWVTIIALYHGCRLNEACQLDVNDVVMEKNIPCFSINSNSKDKSLKTDSSLRTIPIHPKLIDMGFLYYVEYQRKNKKEKLFSDLRQQKRGLYGRSVQAWFARHLDTLGIISETKVFHSFRHTFEAKAVEKRIPSEYQNAICGWTDRGVGQRVYGKKKDIRIMLEELSKIEYPINRELNELKKKFMDSYVLKCMN